MTKKYLTRLLQTSLMCCLAVLFTACDDFFGNESNPTPAYLSMSDKPVTIKVGETFQRQAIATSTAVIEYTSSDTNVATVDNTGLVIGVADGEATITATATGYSSKTGTKIYLPDSKSYKVTVGGGSVVPPGPTPGSAALATPLTMEAITAGTIVVTIPQAGMQYSLNGGAKTAVTTDAITVAVGDKVQFYGKGTSIAAYNNTKIKGGTAEVKVYGNIMSLVDETGFATNTTLTAEQTFRGLFNNNVKLKDASGLLLPAETLTDYCYSNMFQGCKALTAAPALPAKTLANSCYNSMFMDCEALTAAPALPAEKLANNCYDSMFQGCKALTAAPELKAKTLANSCYYAMFVNCTSLTAAPAELPATALAENCYYNMFNCCTSLTTAPALPATSLANYCYNGMFSYCTSLTAAPAELPATSLAEYCYSGMFQGCKKLTAAPALPATSLEKANYCYYNMFNGCTSLTAAPALPATTLAKNCYYAMFYGCTSLTTAPALPATSLAEYCYNYMFQDCTSLITAPEELPATTLKKECYSSMFQGCTKLTAAPKLPATSLAQNCYYYMFYNCTALISAYVKAAYKTSNGECYDMFDGCSATGAQLHTTTTNKEGWQNYLGGGNWSVEDDWN